MLNLDIFPQQYLQIIEGFLGFMGTGGTVLWLILLLNIALWTLILERTWFFFLVHPRQVQCAMTDWARREDHHSWYAHRIREMIIAQMHGQMMHHLIMIRTFVELLPVMGLLGTVVGMIETFEVLTLYGTGNARALASSISLALVTTLAGLVAAIPGLFVSGLLQRRAEQEKQRITDQLSIRAL